MIFKTHRSRGDIIEWSLHPVSYDIEKPSASPATISAQKVSGSLFEKFSKRWLCLINETTRFLHQSRVVPGLTLSRSRRFRVARNSSAVRARSNRQCWTVESQSRTSPFIKRPSAQGEILSDSWDSIQTNISGQPASETKLTRRSHEPLVSACVQPNPHKLTRRVRTDGDLLYVVNHLTNTWLNEDYQLTPIIQLLWLSPIQRHFSNNSNIMVLLLSLL